MTTDTVLVLRTCNPDLTSHGGFQWPDSGHVEAPDCDPTPNCGNGLHGCLWGEGDGSLLNWATDARWLIVEVPTDTIVDLNGKVKFPAGNVVHCGDRLSATTYLLADPRAAGRVVHGATVTGGDEATVTGGYGATVTGGYGSCSAAGTELHSVGGSSSATSVRTAWPPVSPTGSTRPASSWRCSCD